MGTNKVQAITLIVVLVITMAINQIVIEIHESRLGLYAIMLLFLLISTILDIVINKLMVSKKGKSIEEVKWQESLTKSPVLYIVGAIFVGIVSYFLFPTERIYSLLFALYLFAMGAAEWIKDRKPMKMYEDGIYVNGYFVEYDRIEYDKGIEKGQEYINIRTPNGLFIKTDIRVVGREEIEKFERVVGEIKDIGL